MEVKITGKRLGKRAPRLDPRTPQLKNYIRVTPPIPPPEVSWITKATAAEPWPMLANDTLGDCVEAAQLHMIEQWIYYGSGTVQQAHNNDAIKLYEAEGGYVPGDPNTDNGTDMLTALNYWKNTGAKIGTVVHKIAGYVKVDPTNDTEVQMAIWVFGNLFTGIQLPLSAQVQTSWTVPAGGPYGDGSPGSWGGHCVPIMARSPESCTCITWGSVLKMSHNFFSDYVDECYAVLAPDWLNAASVSPGGLDLAQLQADLAAL